MKRWLVILTLALVVMVGLAEFYLPVHAADFSLTVSPSFLVLSTNPGEITTSTIRVQNNGQEQQTLGVGLLRLKPAGEQLLLEPLTESDVFDDWVTFDKDQLTIEPGRSQTVTMTINPPLEAALGYYYALSFQDSRQNTSSDSAVLTGVAAVPILLEVVVPGAQRSVEIVDYHVSRRLFDFLPATFEVTLKNTGNVHVAPRGNIFVSKTNRRQSSTATLATLDVNNNSAGGYILPGSTRTFTTQWTDGFPSYTEPTTANTKSHLRWDFTKVDRLRIGNYKGQLTLVYDNVTRDEAIEGVVYFWVIPWPLLVGIIVLLIIIYNLKSALRFINSQFVSLWRRLRR